MFLKPRIVIAISQVGTKTARVCFELKEITIKKQKAIN